ncbi:MAG: hypothetical protein II336_19840 [Loktanella sp.]|nr:hypothetical protein [Loktanella sp.]
MTEIVETETLEKTMKAVAERALGEAVPPTLQTLTERHLEKVLNLVETMRAAGVDESIVRHSIREIIESYEQELVKVVAQMAEDRP